MMFKFDDLKVNSQDDRMTDRMTTKVLSSRPHIIIHVARPITHSDSKVMTANMKQIIHHEVNRLNSL